MGMSNPDKTLFPLMRVSHIKWSESFRILPRVFAWWWLGSTKRWKTFFPKTSERVTIVKFKVHDAGSIGSLGCTVFELILLIAILAIKTPFLAMDITPWVCDVLLVYLYSSFFFHVFCFHKFQTQGGTRGYSISLGSKVDEKTNPQIVFRHGCRWEGSDMPIQK